MALQTLTIDNVISILSTLAQEEKLTVTVTESLKGGVIAGTSAMIGGLIAGPVGLAAGAIIGGVAAAARAQGKFESVGSVINNMDEKNKEKLYNDAVKLFQELSITDILELQRAVVQMEARKLLVGVIVRHVEGQLHLQITH